MKTQETGGMLAAAQAGVVTAGGILEVVIENAGVSVTESDFDVGRPSEDSGISLLHHYSGSPFRITMVNDPVTHFQI
jgi:hypothetical protein